MHADLAVVWADVEVDESLVPVAVRTHLAGCQRKRSRRNEQSTEDLLMGKSIQGERDGALNHEIRLIPVSQMLMRCSLELEVPDKDKSTKGITSRIGYITHSVQE
jgi:hypothetical protein